MRVTPGHRKTDGILVQWAGRRVEFGDDLSVIHDEDAVRERHDLVEFRGDDDDAVALVAGMH